MTYKLANSSWDNLEINAIQKVISSNMYSMGKEVLQFEAAFASYVGSKYCVMVNSGSSANLLMIAALFFRKNNPLKRGDEVIVPAVSWSTTYMPLQQYGLKVIFVDIDPNTLNFDIQKLAEAVTDKTRAVLSVNLLGNSNDFDAINEIICNKDIILLEDNCESLGAKFNNKQCGTFGVMGTYSTFFSHHISTMEGGLITCDDEEIYHILLSIRSHGWTRHLPENNHVSGVKSKDSFDESFKFVLPGYNLRPVEMSGAIGIEQLKKLPMLVEGRRDNAVKFKEIISQYSYLRSQKEVGESSWFGFSIILEDDAPYSRNDLLEVFKKYSIDVRPIVAGNFTKNPAMKWFDYSISGSLEASDEADSRGLFIGNHHYPMESEFQSLEQALETLDKLKSECV